MPKEIPSIEQDWIVTCMNEGCGGTYWYWEYPQHIHDYGDKCPACGQVGVIIIDNRDQED